MYLWAVCSAFTNVTIINQAKYNTLDLQGKDDPSNFVLAIPKIPILHLLQSCQAPEVTEEEDGPRTGHHPSRPQRNPSAFRCERTLGF